MPKHTVYYKQNLSQFITTKVSIPYNHEKQAIMCNIYLQLQTSKLRSYHSKRRTTCYRLAVKILAQFNG